MKDRRLTIELVLDNVGTWKASKPGKQQHGQLGKHQLGTHKPNTWAGGTREAITIWHMSKPVHPNARPEQMRFEPKICLTYVRG